MSAFRALDAARAAGIEVRLDGKDLVLSGANAPPADVLDSCAGTSSPSWPCCNGPSSRAPPCSPASPGTG